jgi:hypothetical protein
VSKIIEQARVMLSLLLDKKPKRGSDMHRAFVSQRLSGGSISVGNAPTTKKASEKAVYWLARAIVDEHGDMKINLLKDAAFYGLLADSDEEESEEESEEEESDDELEKVKAKTKAKAPAKAKAVKSAAAAAAAPAKKKAVAKKKAITKKKAIAKEGSTSESSDADDSTDDEASDASDVDVEMQDLALEPKKRGRPAKAASKVV